MAFFNFMASWDAQGESGRFQGKPIDTRVKALQEAFHLKARGQKIRLRCEKTYDPEHFSCDPNDPEKRLLTSSYEREELRHQV